MRQIRRDIRGSGRHAQRIVEVNIVVETVVEHSGAIRAAQSTANVNNTDAFSLTQFSRLSVRYSIH